MITFKQKKIIIIKAMSGFYDRKQKQKELKSYKEKYAFSILSDPTKV